MRRILLLGVVLVLAVAACSGEADERFQEVGGEISGGDASTEAGNEQGAGTARGAGADVADVDGEASEGSDIGGPTADLAGAVLVGEGRQIVSTAELTVEVERVDEASTEAAGLVEGVGGALFGETSSFEGEARAVLTLKVPPPELRSLLDRLAELGEPLEQRVESDDVTERVVDLESQITTLEASIVRLRGLLDNAGSVEDIARLENELLDRETRLEQLNGQLRTLEGRIELATITLTLVQPDDEETTDDESALPGFLDGVDGGWNALVTVATVAALVFGALLPWLPVLLIAVLAWRLPRMLGSRPPGREAEAAPQS